MRVSIWISCALPLLLTACGEDLADFSRRTMAQCQEGGLVFEVGEDLDGDGAVNEEEISAIFASKRALRPVPRRVRPPGRDA